MITTHFSDIKNTALKLPDIESASCGFDLKTLKPTYQLIYGITGKSNAIIIAERLGLDTKITNNAKEIAEQTKSGDEKLYDTLADQKEKYLKLYNKYNQKDKMLRQKLALVEEKEKILTEKEQNIKKKEQSELKNIYKKTRIKMQELIDDYSKQIVKFKKINPVNPEIESLYSKLKNDFKDLNKQIDKIETNDKTIKKTSTTIMVSINDIQVGDTVKVKELNKKAIVISKNTKKNEVTVNLGDIKFTMPISDIEISSELKQPSRNKVVIKKNDYDIQIEENTPFEINLIGKRGEEAIEESRNYIEKLYMTGRIFGRIIHGKGSGILRTLIEEMLKQHPYIKNFNLAKPENGGFGVTEIHLKQE